MTQTVAGRSGDGDLCQRLQALKWDLNARSFDAQLRSGLLNGACTRANTYKYSRRDDRAHIKLPFKKDYEW